MANLFHPSRGGFAPLDDRDKERVREASDIVRIIGEVLTLKSAGREFKGLCPFHNDSSPSMTVSPTKQIFKCFACGAGGDVFSFVIRYHRMQFPEALQYLADRAGIELERNKRQAEREQGSQSDSGGDAPVSKADLFEATKVASDFFRAIHTHPEHGAAGRAVVERRGITQAMVDQFLIGTSPDKWDGLLLTLQKKGLRPEVFFDAGLLKKRESGGTYDAFRNRLMFPIQDQLGRVIAFGARRINDDDDPKYLNSPETRLFSKSRTLYGLNHAARTIQSQRTVIITEGYTDAIACHQAGFANTVATLGTALTREHAAILKRLCDRVVLLFDGDEAGQRAADRAVEVFFSEPLDVAICTLNRHTDAKDPDELLKREGGAELFRRALEQSTDLLTYRFARVRDRMKGQGMASQAKAIDEEIVRLVELGLGNVAPVRRAMIVRTLANLARVDEETIRKSIPEGRAARPAFVPPQAEDESMPEVEPMPPVGTAPLMANEHLLGCILCKGSLWQMLREDDKDALDANGYRWPLVGRLADVVLSLGEDGQTPDLSAVCLATSDEAVKACAVLLMERISEATEREEDRLKRHFDACLKRALADFKLRRASLDGEPPPPPPDRLIELKREEFAKQGADRRKLPKPRSG